jgi:hypothetical protein
MKRIIQLSGIIAVCFLASCTKTYQELNENPNGVAVAVPERLLDPAVYDVVQRNLNRNHRITSQLMQVSVLLSDAIEIQRYIIRPSESDYMWNNWYIQKTNFLDMYNLAKQGSGVTASQSKAYMGIASILDAWVTSMLTDTYGDVPYFDANKGKTAGAFTPKFDTQKAIYQDIFRKLEEANTLLGSLASNQLLTANQQGLDALYGKSATNVIEMDRWRKFGNSLYLRLLMRVSAKTDAIAAGKTAVEKISEVVTKPAIYPIFVSKDESAILRLTGETFPLRSPFASFRDADFNGASSLSEFFVNTLKEWGDPRLAVWATRYDNDYIGVPSGYAVGNNPPARSAFSSSLKLEPLLGNMMNYAELQFILAEAAVKGFITGDPKTYYDKGVQAAIEHWGLTMPTNYLTSAPIVWDAAGDLDQKMEQVMAQKYFTLFFTDFQQWFEYRRTGHPVLQVGPGLANNGKMPSRLYYPVLVQSVNRTNYLQTITTNGPDDLNTKVWWQQ